LCESPLSAQRKSQPKRSPEQIRASYDAHKGDFDYLLGEWAFTSVSKEFGEGRGFWSAVRLAEGAEILDEYRVVGDNDETYYASEIPARVRADWRMRAALGGDT
jgi:hypothetical protein